MDTDRIEKTTVLRAPRERVWRALTDAEQFGEWFRAQLEGPFEVGKCTRGKLTVEGYEHLTLELWVERMDPQRLFAFRWHPYAVDPDVDYSNEPTTLVEFILEDIPEGTRLTIVESGFDGIPKGRRAEAFRMNDQGWAIQTENLRAHVDG